MTVVWEKIKAGDVLFERRRQKMGNTTMSHTLYFAVHVKEIDHEKGTALCSWNGNAPRFYSRHVLTKFRRSEPKRKSP